MGYDLHPQESFNSNPCIRSTKVRTQDSLPVTSGGWGQSVSMMGNESPFATPIRSTNQPFTSLNHKGWTPQPYELLNYWKQFKYNSNTIFAMAKKWSQTVANHHIQQVQPPSMDSSDITTLRKNPHPCQVAPSRDCAIQMSHHGGRAPVASDGRTLWATAKR